MTFGASNAEGLASGRGAKATAGTCAGARHDSVGENHERGSACSMMAPRVRIGLFGTAGGSTLPDALLACLPSIRNPALQPPCGAGNSADGWRPMQVRRHRAPDGPRRQRRDVRSGNADKDRLCGSALQGSRAAPARLRRHPDPALSDTVARDESTRARRLVVASMREVSVAKVKLCAEPDAMLDESIRL